METYVIYFRPERFLSEVYCKVRVLKCKLPCTYNVREHEQTYADLSPIRNSVHSIQCPFFSTAFQKKEHKIQKYF